MELPLLDERVKVDPVAMSRFIKQWSKKLGARSVGITELKEHHLYSTIGRGNGMASRSR